jgi:hypothetical protein
VRAQRVQQGLAQRDISIAAPFTALDVNEHRPAVDVLDLPAPPLRVSHGCRIQDHQHRAVGARSGGIDQAGDFVDGQDRGQRTRHFRIGNVVEQVPTLQRLYVEEQGRRGVRLPGTGFPSSEPLTPFLVMCSADSVMFVTHYRAGSWTPMDVIGLGRAYG